MNLETLTNESLALTLQWMEDIKRMMSDQENPLAEMSINEKQAISGLLAKLMRAATGMVKEVRALAKDARDAAEQMTHEDKRKLIVEFIAMMPAQERAELRSELGWL